MIDPVIQRNGYFGHPESLLLSTITDERPAIRELGLRRILKARKVKHCSSIRRFKVPVLNFLAKEHIDLINWQAPGLITEPPVTVDISDDELVRFIHGKETSRSHFLVSMPHTGC